MAQKVSYLFFFLVFCSLCVLLAASLFLQSVNYVEKNVLLFKVLRVYVMWFINLMFGVYQQLLLSSFSNSFHSCYMLLSHSLNGLSR